MQNIFALCFRARTVEKGAYYARFQDFKKSLVPKWCAELSKLGSNKVVRQTVGLPADTARQVRSLAKQRRLSANRIIVELVEEGIEAQKRKQKEFFELAERYRAATDPRDVARLGDDLGRMVFGD
jgi:hypothetical protein